MIRHRRLRPALAVFSLSVAMIESPFQTPLVATVGPSTLAKPRLAPACQAAIALSAITVLTDPEHRLTSTAAANPLPQIPASGAAFEVSAAAIEVFAGGLLYTSAEGLVKTGILWQSGGMVGLILYFRPR